VYLCRSLASSSPPYHHPSNPPAINLHDLNPTPHPRPLYLHTLNLPDQIVLAFAKRVVSAMELGDMAKEPFITFPLLPLAHVVNVSLPGQVGWGG